MKMRNFLAGLVLSTLIISLQQNALGQYKRPGLIDGAPSLNAFITSVYELCNNTQSLNLRVTTMDDNLSKPLFNMDPKLLVSEFNDCSGLMTSFMPLFSNLFQTGAGMTSKIKDEMGRNPFKIIGASLQLKTALKILKTSQENLSAMYKSVMPAARTKIKEKAGDETAQQLAKADTVNALVGAVSSAAVAATESSTTLVIENVAYQDATAITDTLKANPKINSVSKAFSSNVLTLTITHTCDTDELADYFLKTAYGAKVEVIDMKDGHIKLKVK